MTMPGRWLAALAVGSALSACSEPAGEEADAAPENEPEVVASDGQGVSSDTAEAGAVWSVPRTLWGDPDFEGMWPIDNMNGTPLQRPAEFGDRRFLTDAEFAEREERLEALNARYDDETASNKMNIGHWAEMGEPNRLTSLVSEPANGRLPPLTEAGAAKSAELTSSWSPIDFEAISDFNALDRCVTRGMPASMFPFMYNSGMEIIQAPGVVVIRLELIHEARIIPVDGRPALDPKVRNWMGASRGRWEGDTLVIETTNFNGRTPMIIHGPVGNPVPTSEAMRIEERLTRTGPDTIEYQVSVEDPEMLTAAWTAAFPWTRDPDYEIYEYACHEDNHIIRDLMNITRVENGLERIVGE